MMTPTNYTQYDFNGNDFGSLPTKKDTHKGVETSATQSGSIWYRCSSPVRTWLRYVSSALKQLQQLKPIRCLQT
eukprot:scaffold348527_cov18-Prasinocladus_malaysianus.AAC.2